MSRRRNRKPVRRGVVLLIVLSLIILFTLIAVTYAIVAGQYKMHSRAFAKIQQVGDPPRKDLDMAMYQVLRDTSVRSSLNSHSLLRDLYGADQVRGRVTASSSVAGGQFIDLTVASVSGSFAIQAGHYNGCVFTFVTGAQRGHSTRVIGYDPVSSAIRIETQDNDGINVSLPANGDEFVINGRPFNGTGFGYLPPQVNTDQPSLNATVNVPIGGGVNLPVALLPHFAGYSNTTAYQVDVGGADESYDTPDFQNMALAMVPPAANGSNEIIPSYHRQDLLAYWINWLQANAFNSLSIVEMRLVFAYPFGFDNLPGTADDGVAPWSTLSLAQRQSIVDLKRRIIFRPLPEDHPNFSGGNPLFTMAGGTIFNSLDCNGDNKVDMWDVDNDGDGIPDSIWIDPGLPVATDKDGRPYKKLVAFLIRDMDGRINLNAMGALAHLNASYQNNINADARVPGLTAATYLPRGLGYGPGDAYIGNLFGATYATEFTNILRGRYGADQNPGIGGTDDTLSALKSLGIPNNYSTGPGAFGSPPDLSGQGAIALDHYGQPIFANMGGTSETTDDPHDADPLRNRPEDAMYTAAELERVLRANDADVSQLPQRLLQAAPNILGNASNRQVVTTHSSHIPVGPVTLPTELRTSNNAGVFSYLQALQNNAGGGPSLLDLYRVRLTLGGIGNAQLNTQMQKMVPFEILHGQKFDINRWFGNGRDDNGNGVIDEYEEAVAGETVWPNTAPTQFQGVNFSYYNDNPAGTDPRQIFARQLYCLVRVLMDSGYIDQFPFEPTLTAAQKQELTYRRIAQWAINVVEFRDRDAVMTAFEYDVNPWNGWICDGNPATNEATINYTANGVDDDGDGMTDEADEAGLGNDRRLIWGAEYPDLLLMESTAFHNRGVRDTDYDQNQKKIIDNGMMRKDDMDQFRQPQGSLFLELYCPRNSAVNNVSFPYELYDTTNGNLDLGRMAPVRAMGMGQGRQPVWRIVIANSPVNGIQNFASTQQSSVNFEPHRPAPDGLGLTTERIVWFAPNDPGTNPEANMIYYGRSGAMVGAGAPNLQATSNVLLPPSRHAVIGPRLNTIPSAAYLGADGDASTYEPGTETISLAGNTVTVNGYSTVYPTPTPAMGATIQRPLGVVCAAKPPQGWTNQNRQIGINVSEPLPQSGDYYAEPNPSNDARIPVDAYADLAQPHNPVTNYLPDTPYDIQPGAQGNRLRALLGGDVRTRTVNNHRAIFLQRLANPLAAWNPEPTDPVYGAYFDNTLVVNPYITVDWTSVDLTVYSGEDRNTQEMVRQGMNVQLEWRDLNDPDPFQGMPPDERFCTRERGNRVVGGLVDRNFWPPLTTGPRSTNRVIADRCFDYDFKHTLGFVNWTASDNPTVPVAGYEGSPDTTTEQPFPWLTWNNRPYANPLEIMGVPASSPGRLCWEFAMQPGNRIYDASQLAPNDPARYPFGHLLNFFMESPTRTAGQSPEYYRIFDYIETPSQFVGAEKWYNPSTFANTSLTEPATFRPPYNRLSRFREPGRVNINTVFDFREWQAIAQGMPNYSTQGFFTSKFLESRRGYTANAATYGQWPTIFANPFRSAVSSDIAVNFGGADMRKTGVEVGLLRPDPLTNLVASQQPMFAIPSGNRYENTSRNPYFAYRGINRLSNMVSFHSNVYAAWATVGYFYVEPNPTGIDSGHPDGWRLAQEVGSDLGTVERHRAFYLIDRSIPVAFEPGQNHNVDRCILIRRLIE